MMRSDFLKREVNHFINVLIARIHPTAAIVIRLPGGVIFKLMQTEGVSRP